MLLPGPEMSTPSSKPLLHIPYTYIMAATFVAPVFSLLSVVTLGVLLHFEKVTSTHCRVSPPLPVVGWSLSPWRPGSAQLLPTMSSLSYYGSAVKSGPIFALSKMLELCPSEAYQILFSIYSNSFPSILFSLTLIILSN